MLLNITNSQYKEWDLSVIEQANSLFGTIYDITLPTIDYSYNHNSIDWVVNWLVKEMIKHNSLDILITKESFLYEFIIAKFKLLGFNCYTIQTITEQRKPHTYKIIKAYE